MTVEYKMTWCDYLTPCKHFPEIEVGSYHCSVCKYFEGHNGFTDIPRGEYFKVVTNSIKCNYHG
jgi:hypothetical protein